MSKKDLKQAQTALKSCVSAIAAAFTEIASVKEGARQAEERLLLTVGINLDQGVGFLKQVTPDADWREWARERVQDAGYSASVGTIYRYRNAGAVARLLEGQEHVSQVSYLTMVPGYRFLAAVKNGTDEEKAAGQAQVLAWWQATLKAAGRGKVPTSEQALTTAEDIAPATQGKEGQTAEERKQAQTKKSAARNTPKTPEDTAGQVEQVLVDPALIESAQGVIDSQIRGKVRTFCEKNESAGELKDPLSSLVRSVMVMTIRDVLQHGPEVMAQALNVKVTKK